MKTSDLHWQDWLLILPSMVSEQSWIKGSLELNAAGDSYLSRYSFQKP